MESEEPFGDEMPNFDIFGTVFKELFKDIDVLDVDAKTETAASSENSGRKSTENEQNKRKRSIVILEDDEIEEFQSKQVAKNTVKGTESAVRRLEAWYNDRYGKELVLSSINKTNASDLLKHFFLEIRDTRKDSLGEEYEPSTLSTYRNGLRRYFLERKDGESFDIGKDEDLKKKLAAKKKQLKAEGKGNRPHRADPLDENQMEKLWTTGAVGLKTPRQLLHLVWWNNTRMLGMRGRQEHLNCKVQDFKDQGNYYEYTERSTKTRTGETDDPKARRKYNNKIFRGNGDERDAYVALKKYLSHRPEGIDEFYLQPIDSPKENIWYKKLPMKRDGLANIMKRMAEKAEIKNEGNFTNTSGRKTAIQSLRGHFDPLAISELTGHANPSSIQSYSHNSIQTQKEMFDRLATPARSSSTAVYNNTATTVNASTSNQRQFFESLFNNNTLNSCQINIHFPTGK